MAMLMFKDFVISGVSSFDDFKMSDTTTISAHRMGKKDGDFTTLDFVCSLAYYEEYKPKFALEKFVAQDSGLTDGELSELGKVLFDTLFASLDEELISPIADKNWDNI